MTCNGVDVILPRRWGTLGSCTCAKQQMCRWSVCFILIVLLIEIIMIWTTPVMFLRNLSIFCLRRATFFYCFDARGRKERERCYRNGRRLLTLHISENIFKRKWDSVSAYVKNRTVSRTVSGRIRICRIKECKSESVQYRNGIRQ